MSQRNPMNDRYNDEKRSGKTRKSSASAKPKAQRAATVRDPAPKSKKQKKEERRERERQAEQKASMVQSRFEDTEGYKRLRRMWWVFLVAAVLSTALTFFLSSQRSSFFGEGGPGYGGDALFLGFMDESMASGLGTALLVMAYAFIIIAFYIDLGRIRKERKIYNASILNDKSKAARKEQKRIKAEQREMEKEAAEKYEAAKEEEEAKKAARGSGLLGRFFKRGGSAGSADEENSEGEGSEKDKQDDGDEKNRKEGKDK